MVPSKGPVDLSMTGRKWKKKGFGFEGTPPGMGLRRGPLDLSMARKMRQRRTPRFEASLRKEGCFEARSWLLDLSMARKRRQRRTPRFEASLGKEGCFEARRWPLDLSMARKRRFGKRRQACRTWIGKSSTRLFIPARGGKGLQVDPSNLVPALPGAVAEQVDPCKLVPAWPGVAPEQLCSEIL